MPIKQDKWYVVSERWLKELHSSSTETDTNRERVDKANKICRSVEVPDWATLFAGPIDEKDPYGEDCFYGVNKRLQDIKWGRKP